MTDELKQCARCAFRRACGREGVTFASLQPPVRPGRKPRACPRPERFQRPCAMRRTTTPAAFIPNTLVTKATLPFTWVR